jgi:uncharacterized protein (DUF433 family)
VHNCALKRIKYLGAIEKSQFSLIIIVFPRLSDFRLRASAKDGRGAGSVKRAILTVMNVDRITVEPRVAQGQPTLRGMRYTVAFVLKLVASGYSAAEIVGLYPELEEDDVRQAAAYGAWLATEQTLPFSPDPR